MESIWIIIGHENHPDREVIIHDFYYSSEDAADQACKELNEAAHNWNRPYNHQLYRYSTCCISPGQS